MLRSYRFFLFSSNIIRAQDWPVGTTWVYEQYEFTWPFYDNNYIIFQIRGDTIVQNKDAKVLEEFDWRSDFDSSQTHKNQKLHVIHVKDGGVSLWIPDSSKFLLIYDFKLQLGDTTELYVGPERNKIHPIGFERYLVYKVDQVETSGGLKNRMYLDILDHSQCSEFREGIIEDIGCEYYFFQNFCLADPGLGGRLVFSRMEPGIIRLIPNVSYLLDCQR